MKVFYLFLLLPLGLLGQNRFCITNETQSNNYQFRVEYTCAANAGTTGWTNWTTIPVGPSKNSCAANADFTCKGEWTAVTVQISTGTENNMATIKLPDNYTPIKRVLFDPKSDNLPGGIVWESLNTVHIY